MTGSVILSAARNGTKRIPIRTIQRPNRGVEKQYLAAVADARDSIMYARIVSGISRHQEANSIALRYKNQELLDRMHQVRKAALLSATAFADDGDFEHSDDVTAVEQHHHSLRSLSSMEEDEAIHNDADDFIFDMEM
eukprot:CAMPEP_0198112850 /NCGR_PEP_ID=MMETSP1442-20131203/4634_1 /TAXON_ID= /ORGANISM="Craspedostauros australis, Strain CCMP3328" /LENGTH=136 /DNA_ID=CAMNT_0043769765 /DNA_START=309 /DNA_END=719 /DNA_ORIENTATION=-